MSEAFGAPIGFTRGFRVSLCFPVFPHSACAGATESAASVARPDVSENHPVFLAGYLMEEANVDSLALLARGLEFGESRIVCNVNWRGDVATRRVFAAVVALLHDDARFQSDMIEAKREIREARERGKLPAGRCGAVAHETRAAGASPPGARGRGSPWG